MQAFPGNNTGEQECKILFCSVHLMRTWLSKIYEDKTQSIIVAAIHKKIELKRTTSHLNELISVAHKVIDLDQKKQIDAEDVAFNFHMKKISVYSIEDEIIKEIHKFPYPMQLMLIKEANAVMDRKFQEIFEESSFEAYEHHELVIIE
ncbi:4969_t:CDS:2, partial [Scutellospora calospora]